MPRESPAVAEGRAHVRGRRLRDLSSARRLGDIDGIYSDLLLHDMGPALSDSGSYYGISEPDSSKDGVKRQEWRTPPLWGFRDSGPYLHDGRAKNLEEAVALHGGEAAKSRKVLQARSRGTTPSPGVPPIAGAAAGRRQPLSRGTTMFAKPITGHERQPAPLCSASRPASTQPDPARTAGAPRE